MESLSKIKLTAEDLDRVSRTFLDRGVKRAHEFTDGWFNTIWALELAGVKKVVLKISPPPSLPVMRYERGIIHAETRVLKLLRSRGYPVPEVLASADSTERFDHPCFFMDWLDGESWSRRKGALREIVKAEDGTGSALKEKAEKEIVSVDRELGIMQARINSIRSGEIPRFGPLQREDGAPPTWREAFTRMVEDLLSDAEDMGVLLPAGRAEILSLVRRAEAILDQVTLPDLVIWDLHDGNVIVDEGTISGLLDCDRALRGDPLMECWFRGLWGGPDPAFVESWLQGARIAAQEGATIGNGLDRHENASAFLADPEIRARIALYDLYLALVMRIECAFRGFPADHVEWATSLARKTYEQCNSML